MAALLVDLDGTLVDTADANYSAYAAALDEAGAYVSREDFDEVSHGRNWKEFLPPLLANVAARPEAVAARKEELYRSFVHLTVLNQGVARLLALSRPAFRTALVTTASRPNVDMILDHHDLAGLFDLVITGSDVTRHKPDPEAYCLAAARLGVTPKSCIVIEDSDIGVASARAFGAAILRIQPV